MMGYIKHKKTLVKQYPKQKVVMHEFTRFYSNHSISILHHTTSQHQINSDTLLPKNHLYTNDTAIKHTYMKQADIFVSQRLICVE